MSLKYVLSLLVALAAVQAIGAQEPGDRDRLERLRDELRGIPDFTALAERESLLVERAREDRENPIVHLELGFVNYRLGELANENRYYETAAGEFEWATELRPDWPYGWYGLGMAELALGEHDVIAIENIRQVLGIDNLSRAAGAFATAAEVDPTFVQAVVDLATAADRQRIKARTEVALEALRRTAATEGGESPLVQMWLGRVYRDVEQPDSARLAFREYLRVGGDSSLGLLELARTEFLLGNRRDGERHYYVGARLALSEESVSEYRSDIEWVADSADLIEFDELGGAGLDEWLALFWGRRDALDLRAPGERLTEHFRRFFYARQSYRLLTRHRRYDITDRYRSEQREFDDRGIVYIRHGAPDRVATYNLPDVEPNESWEYQHPDGPVIFHFAARGDVADYKLIESLIDVYGFRGALALQTGGPANVDRGLFASRNHFSAIYRRLSTAGTASITTDLANERQMGSRAIEVGTTTDSYTLRFASAMEARIETAIVEEGEDGGTLLVGYAVPGASLRSTPSPRGFNYRVQLRFSALIDGNRPMGYVDTSRVYTLTREIQSDEYLAGMMAMPLPPGDYQVRVLVADPVSGAGMIVTDTLAVLASSSRERAVGEFIVGFRGWGLDYELPADTVYLNPTQLYPVGARLDLYYELHGLAPGESYRASIEVRKDRGGSVLGFVRRLFGSGGNRIRVEFPGVSESGGVLPVSQVVDLSPLDPGRYAVRLEVEFADGTNGSFERQIEVLP